MENNQKRSLLTLAYYALIGVAMLFSVLFILRTSFSTLPFIIQVIYFIWAGALIVNLAFDVYCTMKHRMKYISGIIFFILALLCVVMGIVVFVTQGVSVEVIRTLEITYFINIFLSFTPIVLGVYAFLFGEKIINFID